MAENINHYPLPDLSEPVCDQHKPHMKSKDEMMKVESQYHRKLFDLEDHEIFGIYGPPGSGKSTLLKLIDLSLSTEEDASLSENTTERAQRQLIDRLNTIDQQYRGLTPFELVLDSLQDADLSSRETRVRVKRALAYLCGEGEVYGEPVRQSPRALIQKLSILQAWLHTPRYLLLDEPTAGVSIKCKQQIHQILREIQRESGTTIILTTKDPGEAEALCNRLALVDRGRVIALGETSRLKDLLDPSQMQLTNLADLHSAFHEHYLPYVD